jgi:hypothetical protein
VANSETEFRQLVKNEKLREEWFAETDVSRAAAQGPTPDENQCIGFTTPLVFQDAGSSNAPYVADIYEYVGFLGDLNRQLSGLPDGSKVRLKVTP